MPFDAFMGRCLYDPEHGYYAAPERRVGRRGDFHTSVSVGPVFGELVAAWAHQSWRDMGSPAPVALVEQGAHDGQLMADVLAALAARHPDLSAVAQPVVVEPLPARREEQRPRLTAGPPVSWRSTLEELAEDPAPHALFFANELLDAFPVARWRFDDSGWNQLVVALTEDGAFAWHRLPAPGFCLPGEPAIGGETLPAGYETETCPGLGSWTGALARAFGRARVLLLDYGREADDYFAPHRTAGTLRGYHRHRRCDDPFAAPGETDLTADVNFSHLAAEARRAGFRCTPPERQGTFLTRLATPRLLDHPPPGPAWLRQFQTLTHPNQLGHLFHAVVLEKPGGP
jgi:SAM-dependent MidA family methyltransferase